tara:strand:+ start:573 stop:908 length:336 start_codon:yes stop_codon:yes gene_type:complete
MIAIATLIYAAKVYRKGDPNDPRAMVCEKIGTYAGISSLVIAVIALFAFAHYGAVVDAGSAQLDALAAMGCDSKSTSEMCTIRAMDCIDQVTYAASAKAWATMILLAAVVI